MAKKSLDIGSIEVNMKFKDREEAYRYMKRLIEHIRYVCKKNANKGWLAQAMIVSSNLKSDVGKLKYENRGKRGRPPKYIDISENIAYGLYKGDYKTDWHIHILLVSKPGCAFRDEIKRYIDKYWIGNKEESIKKIVYKKDCNIKMADYFINQCVDVLFCNHNFGEEEDLKYSLKEYYREYMKMEKAKKRLYSKHREKPMSDNNYLKALDKIESKFNMIEKYFYDISKERDKKKELDYMKRVQFNRIKDNYNKVQDVRYKKILDNGYI